MPDSEYIFEVDVPPDVESFSNINTDTNPFEVTVKIKAAGNILSNLDARESLCSKAMTNDANLGICSEFIYDEGCKIEEAVIQFKIDYENAVEADTKKAEDSESYGIKKYSIFKFFEDTGILLHVTTEIDEENNTLSTTVDSLCSYCVIDMEKLLNDWLEFEAETEEQPEVFQSVCSSVMYAMKMGFEDSLNIIITDKAHELLLEHGGVVGLVAELTIQALNALLNISEEAKISIYTYGAATMADCFSEYLKNQLYQSFIIGEDYYEVYNNDISKRYFVYLAKLRLYSEDRYCKFRNLYNIEDYSNELLIANYNISFLQDYLSRDYIWW